MGHVLLVPFAWAADWPTDIDVLRHNGFRLLAMTPNRQARVLADEMDAVAGQKVALLVGAEGPGLTETTMRAADVRVRVPMSGDTDSLNVATAAALAFYERARCGGGGADSARTIT
jgi:tRNA G18 (ribose-2'-O)-methylase SpoU